jgi:hypothetical protein
VKWVAAAVLIGALMIATAVVLVGRSASPDPVEAIAIHPPSTEPLPSFSSLVSPSAISPTAEPSPVATAPAFFALGRIREQIQEDMRGIWDDVFCGGREPTEKELERWTRYIIGLGNRLQVKLPLQLALAEAEAKAHELLYYSPGGQWAREPPPCVEEPSIYIP